MSINNLPAPLQSAIQTGMLAHDFGTPLTARLGFRDVATREPFPAGIGETLTKTKQGLLLPVTTPLAPAANTDLTSGITPVQYGVEQYTMTVNQYGSDMMLNMATSRVAIADLYLKNAFALGEQAARSVDLLARDALYAPYLAGNTRVRTTLGAAGATVALDDVRSISAGQVLVFSGASSYTVASVAVDGTNVSTVYLGQSGSVTFSSNVSVADGTAGNSVIGFTAPSIFRPNGKTTTANLTATDKLTMSTILAAKAGLEADAIPHGPRGMYMCYADPVQLTGLYQDPAFQQFFRGQIGSPEYRKGVVAELLGVEIIQTNVSPVFSNGSTVVRNAIVCGQGALIEGTFTPTAYANVDRVENDGTVTVVDGIAHVTRAPIDALQQVVTQAWSYIGGFTAPTDALTTSAVLPTASNATFKRAKVIQSA